MLQQQKIDWPDCAIVIYSLSETAPLHQGAQNREGAAAAWQTPKYAAEFDNEGGGRGEE